MSMLPLEKVWPEKVLTLIAFIAPLKKLSLSTTEPVALLFT